MLANFILASNVSKPTALPLMDLTAVVNSIDHEIPSGWSYKVVYKGTTANDVM